MNVTEAVDSLSAMFHPSAQLTQPHLPVTYLHITLKSSFLHLLTSFLKKKKRINLKLPLQHGFDLGGNV